MLNPMKSRHDHESLEEFQNSEVEDVALPSLTYFNMIVCKNKFFIP